MGDKIGTIELAKFAAIIIIDGDPLADIRIIQDRNGLKVVMLKGKVELDRGL